MLWMWHVDGQRRSSARKGVVIRIEGSAGCCTSGRWGSRVKCKHTYKQSECVEVYKSEKCCKIFIYSRDEKWLNK